VLDRDTAHPPIYSQSLGLTLRIRRTEIGGLDKPASRRKAQGSPRHKQIIVRASSVNVGLCPLAKS
jgi:hypothetical protein